MKISHTFQCMHWLFSFGALVVRPQRLVIHTLLRIRTLSGCLLCANVSVRVGGRVTAWDVVRPQISGTNNNVDEEHPGGAVAPLSATLLLYPSP